MNNTNTNTIVKAQNVTLQVQDHTLLENIDFEVKKDQIMVFMGKNGSGKTVLLKTLVGLFAPQKGRIELFQKELKKLTLKEQTALRHDIGYVFQKSGLFDSLTVAQNVVFAMERFSKESHEQLEEKAIELLASAGLKKEVARLMPSELSGGMQKRAGIARAIALDPKLLIMDDPTAGLDPVLSDAIADLVISIQKRLGTTILLATHDLKLAYKLGDYIGLLHQGRVVSLVTKEEFQTSTNPYIEQFRTGRLEGPIPVIDT